MNNFNYNNIVLDIESSEHDSLISINTETGEFNANDSWWDFQQILNRMYSLHISLDYEELIKNNKAVSKK